MRSCVLVPRLRARSIYARFRCFKSAKNLKKLYLAPSALLEQLSFRGCDLGDLLLKAALLFQKASHFCGVLGAGRLLKLRTPCFQLQFNPCNQFIRKDLFLAYKGLSTVLSSLVGGPGTFQVRSLVAARLVSLLRHKGLIYQAALGFPTFQMDPKNGCLGASHKHKGELLV